MIDRCPACGYSLEGLPENHRCPECGQRYDRTWIVIDEDLRTWKAIGIGSAGLVLLGAATWYARGDISPGLIGGGMLLATAVYQLCRRRVAVAVSETEFWILRKGATEDVFAMEDIGYAKWNWISGEIVVYRGDRILVTIRKPFWGRRVANGAVSLINGYADKARSRTEN